MNEKDKSIIIDRYKERLEKYGPSIQSLASGTEARRLIRFKQLESVGDINGSKILDLGSGLGDFYKYLKDKQYDFEYVGYDISPDLVAIANKNYPEAKFEVRDIQQEDISESFDYVVSSQTFNFKLSNEENLDLVKTCLIKSLKASKKGICFDFLSKYVDFEENHLFYYQPEELFTFAKSLSKKVALKHDTELYEFAIFIYQDFVGWK
jgi:SAM-dependent methyltransferase